MFDFILHDGNIIDGSGTVPYKGDIGIKNDKIAAIGNLKQYEADCDINLDNLAVSPGFIDLHTHSDFTLLVNSNAESQVHQGVTTEVVGQCGHGCAPVSDSSIISKYIIGYHRGIDIDWQSFGEYLDRLDSRELGVNVAAMVGYGPIYLAVKGTETTQITPNELEQMKKLLEQSLSEGAVGFSTGLEYWPGNITNIEEINELCDVVSKYNALYATHVRNRDLYYDLGFVEALSTARNADVSLQISHIQPKYGAPKYAMEHTLSMIHHSLSNDVDVYFDVIPDEWSFTTMSSILPASAFEGGLSNLMNKLTDHHERNKLKSNLKPIWQLVKANKWDKIALLRADNSPNLVGLTFDEISYRLGVDPLDAVLDILYYEGDNLYNATWTSRSFFEDDVKLCLKQQHCGVISDNIALAPYGQLKNTQWSPTSYNWTARLFEHYVRDQNVITLVEAVRKITSLPANRLGLKNRGLLKPGYYADITVFDPQNISDKSSLKNPNVYPDGIVHVFVNGCLELSNGSRNPSNGGLVLKRT